MVQRSVLKALISSVLALGVTAVIAAQAGSAALRNAAGLKEQAPATYNVNFDTSAGTFVVDVTRAWAPNGADRFYNLVKNGYYNEARFFRVVPGFMVQFGINGSPALNQVWQTARIPDDPVKESNRRGYITFATAGPNTRTTQVFINFKDNDFLNSQGFTPFGKVSSGMDIVDKIYSGYGDMPAMRGNGPDPSMIGSQGNAYLTRSFPKLDFIKTATIESGAAKK